MTNSVLDLFNNENLAFVKVCAPMVRYSKLQYRKLVRMYDCNLCFTPMIMADSYIKSPKARNHEFQTDDEDRPLIVQFGANNSTDFISASELIIPHCDGVDLNCGCPQKWALQDGYGAHLLKNPEIIKDCVSQLRNRLPLNKTISVKLRILNNNRESVDLCRQIEAAGVSFITVHGRTPLQKKDPVNLECIKLINDSVNIPVIFNGGIKNLSDAIFKHNFTGCRGVMSATSILHNPGLFAGYDFTPVSAIENWLKIQHTNFFWFHHHLVFMCEHLLIKKDRIIFNNLKNANDVVSFLEEKFDIKNVLSSNRTLGKKLSATPGTYYQSITSNESIQETADLVDELSSLFC
ncbi:tRNA-dihydrouridine(20a/20b) synthase [NAD(P)+]-like [Daktulosphaira vitifoliae]|uniref:tRNA-dihydrouridine(20a/20b) synthase [NAD(P)+]-like n=1 Tax=Daktulosphaira vitifoliae TaxID=58002 RepID=UPI0021AAC137|nr:tRNA-dihydrouridine(20a/20b) synthase [NAD(P)+]-like [Daktulosphaira vitifoliae]